MTWTLLAGSSSALGIALSKSLLKRSPHVAMQGKEQVEKIVGKHCFYGDFSTHEGVELFVDKYLSHCPSTRCLVYNVGPYLHQSVLNTSVEEAQFLLQTNLLAPMYLVQRLMPSLQKSHGSIIFIGFVGVSSFYNDVFQTMYHIAKTALYQLMRSLAKQLKALDVSVNMVSPGYLRNSNSANYTEALDYVEYSDVVETVEFLLDHPKITGQNIEVARGVRL